MDALNQITEGMTGQEVAQIIYQNDSNSLTDYIVSYLHPTEGVNGTNVYTLTTAIAKIPQDIRKQGITCTFLSINGWLSYKYIGNTIINDNWNTTSNWILIATEKELSNLATQNSMMEVISTNKSINVDFSDTDISVTISLPPGLYLSYGNTRITDSATTNGQVITDPMTAGKLRYLVYDLNENQYKLTDSMNQMTNSVLVGWINQYFKEAILRCNNYFVNGVSRSFRNYIPKSNIAHDLTTTDTNKVLGADQAIQLATQNGMMEVLGEDRTVSIDFSDSDFSVTISLPDKLLLSYGNTRIIDSATSNGQVITDSMTNYRYKYLIYNLTTSKYELVLQTAQMNNSVLVGWINQYTKTAVLRCDNYTVNGYASGKSLAQIVYNNIPTTVIQLKKYADDGYALLQLTSSIDTEVKITGGYASFNAVDFTETSIGIKKKTLTNVYFKCVESYAIIEAKGVYSITVGSNLTYNYISQNIKDFGNSLTQLSSSYNNNIYGEIKDFNRYMTYISIGEGTISKPNISGELKELPRLLTHLQLRGNTNIINGDVADLPRKLEYIYLNTGAGSKTTGNVADLPRGLTILRLYNLVLAFMGDIKDLPPNLTELLLFGSNFNISGNIKDIPSNITNLQIGGLSTILGNIADIPQNMRFFALYNGSNVYGNLSDMPSNITYFNAYNRADGKIISGDLGDIPNKNMTDFKVIGNLNITFDKDFPLAPTYSSFSIIPDDQYPIDSATVDKILIALDSKARSSVGTRNISLTGACATPTEASQAAITSLQQKGFTVQTN